MWAFDEKPSVSEQIHLLNESLALGCGRLKISISKLRCEMESRQVEWGQKKRECEWRCGDKTDSYSVCFFFLSFLQCSLVCVSALSEETHTESTKVGKTHMNTFLSTTQILSITFIQLAQTEKMLCGSENGFPPPIPPNLWPVSLYQYFDLCLILLLKHETIIFPWKHFSSFAI